VSLRLKPLDEQVIVITGASSGIGLVTARTAAGRGASVFLVSRDGAALAQIAAELTAKGCDADFHVADVGDVDQVRAAADGAVKRFGRIDTWVNDAGVAIYASLEDTPVDEHQKLFQTNYFGTVNGALAALPYLKRQGGALITVGSIVGDVAPPLMGAYGASKHAIKGFVRSLRIELQAAGAPVSVTLIKPSGIDTPVWRHAADHADGAGRIPPPVYDPMLVADAILDAAVHPRREVTVGGGGRLQVLFGTHFPRAWEAIAPIGAQLFTAHGKQQPRPSNLYAPVGNLAERSGKQSGRKTSVYTSVAKRPGLAGMVLATAVLGGVLAARRGRV